MTAQTSAISGGEPDPTKLVAITDVFDAMHLPTGGDDQEHDRSGRFTTLRQSRPGEVFRGVALPPTP